MLWAGLTMDLTWPNHSSFWSQQYFKEKDGLVGSFEHTLKNIGGVQEPLQWKKDNITNPPAASYQGDFKMCFLDLNQNIFPPDKEISALHKKRPQDQTQ